MAGTSTGEPTRRVGITRSSHKFAPLHPNARDSRSAESQLKRKADQLELDINAPPESSGSSEDELSSVHESEPGRAITGPVKRRKTKVNVRVPRGAYPVKERAVETKSNDNDELGWPALKKPKISYSTKSSTTLMEKGYRAKASKTPTIAEEVGTISPPKARGLHKDISASRTEGTQSRFKGLKPTSQSKTTSRGADDGWQEPPTVKGLKVKKVNAKSKAPEIRNKRPSKIQELDFEEPEIPPAIKNSSETPKNRKTRQNSRQPLKPSPTSSEPTPRAKRRIPSVPEIQFEDPAIDFAKTDLDEEAVSRYNIELIGSGGDSPLSDTFSLSQYSEFDQPLSSNTSTGSVPLVMDKTSCPMCNAPVDVSVVALFYSQLGLVYNSRSRLSLQQQKSLHRHHSKIDAETTWQQRHYPMIDWAHMTTRLNKHTSYITSILDKTRHSHYRDQLRQKLSGLLRKDRTLAHELATGQDGTEQMGYYGPRGQRAFGDWLIEKFSSTLRKQQESDSDIVSAGGVSIFVQKVLVPELAHAMFLEDLNSSPKMVKAGQERAIYSMMKEASAAGKSEEEIQEAIEDIDSVPDSEGDTKLDWLAIWIAAESAECGVLLSEEQDDVVIEDNEEEAM
jgi:hypothetical protein